MTLVMSAATEPAWLGFVGEPFEPGWRLVPTSSVPTGPVRAEPPVRLDALLSEIGEVVAAAHASALDTLARLQWRAGASHLGVGR